MGREVRLMRARPLFAALLALAGAASLGAAVLGGCNGQTVASDAGPGCPASQISCNGTCVDTESDPGNCGGCGTTCDPAKVCSRGQCNDLCTSAQTACPLMGGGAEGGPGVLCVSTQTDNTNCGSCGKACPAEQTCVGGSCKSLCSAGQTGCMPEGGGAPYCVSIQSDNANCGGCGHGCAAQQICMGGTCIDECLKSQKACPDPEGGAPFCADIQTDNDNCGSCGHTCSVEQSCTMGTCMSACTATQTLCVPDGGGGDDGGPFCADIKTDSQNCGSCGNVCPFMTPLCSAGQCESAG
jgi:hypothetical protein